MINNDQLVCLEVPPAPVYEGSKGRGWPAKEGGAGGVLLLPGVGLPPPILFQLGLQGGKRERGGRPPLLVLIGLGEGGGAQPAMAAPFTFPLRPM